MSDKITALRPLLTTLKVAHTHRRLTTHLRHIHPSHPTPTNMTSTNGVHSNAAAGADSVQKHPILMIPGPTEYHPQVLSKLAEPSLSHTSPAFIKEFSALLKGLRTVFAASESAQPVVISGSGTIGWDIAASNLCEPGDTALVLNTGYFSDSYAVCCETYGVQIEQIKAKQIGDTIDVQQLELHLSSTKTQYKLICITQVDTSTAVLNDCAALIKTVKKHQPNALISVDGVCSFGGERFYFDEWQVDCAIGCSQKALGAPPGLSVLVFSQRALEAVKARKTAVTNYFGSLNNWLPIMRAYESNQPAYFATPNVNLIKALNHSITLLNEQKIQRVFELHEETGRRFRAAMKAMKLKFVPTGESYTANTLLAIYYPESSSFKSADFLPTVSKSNVILAGGLHKDIKPKYFRVGTMGYSVWGGVDYVERTVQAIEDALVTCGYSDVQKGEAVKVFKQTK